MVQNGRVYDSHSYPSYAPDPGSRRLPRPVGDRRLGVVAAFLGILVSWLVLSAILPDVGHALRLTMADLSGEIRLTPVGGSPDPQVLAALAGQRLERAELLFEVVIRNGEAVIRVDPDDEAEARRWVLPQGRLELLYASDAGPTERELMIQAALGQKASGSYDPFGPIDALPHPYEDHYVLLMRPVNLPPDWLDEVELDTADDGRPVFDLSLSAAGFTAVKTIQLEARKRDLAAVLDGKLISLSRNRTTLLPYLELDPGPLAWNEVDLKRALTQIQTRYPVALLDAP